MEIIEIASCGNGKLGFFHLQNISTAMMNTVNVIIADMFLYALESLFPVTSYSLLSTSAKNEIKYITFTSHKKPVAMISYSLVVTFGNM